MYLPHNPFQSMPKYIYQSANWPNFTWNDLGINLILGKVGPPWVEPVPKAFGMIMNQCVHTY